MNVECLETIMHIQMFFVPLYLNELWNNSFLLRGREEITLNILIHKDSLMYAADAQIIMQVI